MTHPFITFREPDKDGSMQYFILQKEFPHFLARLVYAPVTGSLSCQPISDYKLWVSCEGSIRGRMIPNYVNIKEEMDTIIYMMTNWFYAERIMMDEKRFKKFKL